MSVPTVSNALDVLLFSREAGKVCPDVPTVMNAEKVMFIVRMIMSELDELVCTVTHSSEECESFMREAMNNRDACTNFQGSYTDPEDIIAAQADALVDSWYYSLNTAAQHGMNLSSIFDLVHASNMAKKDPVTGKFLKRESDGKIIKPKGWTSPDIRAEIIRQIKEGSWT
jgi:predicted HAD superfamily Cof-like phosphohydrolase